MSRRTLADRIVWALVKTTWLTTVAAFWMSWAMTHWGQHTG